MIQGVKISKRKQIIDVRGKIIHMLRNDDDAFTKFAEICLLWTFRGSIKAWHIHKEMTSNYSIIYD